MKFRVTIHKEVIVTTDSDHIEELKRQLEALSVEGIPTPSDFIDAVKADFDDNGMEAIGDPAIESSDLDIAILEGDLEELAMPEEPEGLDEEEK